MSDSSGWSSPDDRSDRPQDPPPQQPYQAYPQYGGAPQYVPKPGVIPFRPLGVGEILDGAITTMRTYPKQMLGVSALVSITSNLLSLGVLLFMVYQTDLLKSDLPLFATQDDVALEDLRLLLVAAIPTVIIAMLFRMFLTGVLPVVIGKAVLGQPITAGEAWREIRPRLGVLIGTSVFFGLLVVVGTVLLALPGVWVYVLFSFATSALILEGATFRGSFTRSRVLVTGAWWRTFWILVLAALIASVLATIIELPFSLLSGDFNAVFGGGPVPGLTLSLVLTAVATILAETFSLPFTAGVTTLTYIDRRMRREGMDIELTRMVTAPPQQPSPQPEPDGGPA